MTIRELLNQGIIMLKNEKIDSPKTKARLILESTLNKSREYLIIYDKNEVTSAQRDNYIKKIKRVILGEPVQYITGLQEFMKLNFFVTKDVLIPRQDTEVLVEEVIKIAKDIPNPVILDLCTGSGAIAVSLAKYIPNSKIYGIDISEKALEVAKKNAEFNGVKNSIEFRVSDLFNKIRNQKFDIIVSNPPYIRSNVINNLPKQVQNEPHLALDGGEDGLKFYKKIIEQSCNYIENGYLILEIGYDQKEDVENLLKENKNYSEIKTIQDFSGNDRCTIAKVGKI